MVRSVPVLRTGAGRRRGHGRTGDRDRGSGHRISRLVDWADGGVDVLRLWHRSPDLRVSQRNALWMAGAICSRAGSACADHPAAPGIAGEPAIRAREARRSKAGKRATVADRIVLRIPTTARTAADSGVRDLDGRRRRRPLCAEIFAGSARLLSSNVTTLVFCGGAIGIMGNIVSGRFSDRFGRRSIGACFLLLSRCC